MSTVLSYILSLLVTICVLNLLSFPLKPAEQETTQFALLFSQYYKKSSKVNKHGKSHSSQEQYNIYHNTFLMNGNESFVTSKGYQLHEFQVRISQILDKLAIEVQLEHATFEPPAVPTHAQTGTLTASPVVPCS